MLYWLNYIGNINLACVKQKNWRIFVDEWLTLCIFLKLYDEDWKGWGMFNLGKKVLLLVEWLFFGRESLFILDDLSNTENFRIKL